MTATLYTVPMDEITVDALLEDIALWDIHGKKADLPLRKMAGGSAAALKPMPAVLI